MHVVRQQTPISLRKLSLNLKISIIYLMGRRVHLGEPKELKRRESKIKRKKLKRRTEINLINVCRKEQ